MFDLSTLPKPKPACFQSLDWSHFIRQYAEMLWSVFGQAVTQISMELKHHYRVEGLEDVRVIRDRQTSKYEGRSQVDRRQT